LSREIQEISVQITQLQNLPASEESAMQLRSLRSRLIAAHKNVSEATKQAQALRRESLVVGLKYLDTNMSGSIEPEDMPGLSADLFSRLDARNKHKISSSDLMAGVDKMEKTIDTANARIADLHRDIDKLDEERQGVLMGVDETPEKRSLRAEQLALNIKSIQETVQQCVAERDKEDAYLRQTYALFQHGFVESLFAKLGSGDAGAKGHYVALSGDLEQIEQKMKNLGVEAEQSSKGLQASLPGGSAYVKHKTASPALGSRTTADPPQQPASLRSGKQSPAADTPPAVEKERQAPQADTGKPAEPAEKEKLAMGGTGGDKERRSPPAAEGSPPGHRRSSGSGTSGDDPGRWHDIEEVTFRRVRAAEADVTTGTSGSSTPGHSPREVRER